MRFTLLAIVALLFSSQSYSRSVIEVVGSSTVYPFATVVAERVGKSTGIRTPKIESTGTGGGMKLFCGGVGTRYPDATNASRKIKDSEVAKCASNGVTDILEVNVGYDGIVFANSKQSEVLNATRKEIFLALAKEVPDSNGNLIANPYIYWSDIEASLPNKKIEVLGPPPTSGTRDAFVELAMEGGCKKFPEIKAMKKVDKKAYKAICHTIREDGVYIETGENDNLIIQKLTKNKEAYGIFGFSFLDQNADVVQGSLIEGVEPTFENIADKSYSVSRPLYFYVKKAHVGVVPGIAEYVREFTSEKARGDDGYLLDKGLIPLSKDLRDSFIGL